MVTTPSRQQLVAGFWFAWLIVTTVGPTITASAAFVQRSSIRSLVMFQSGTRTHFASSVDCLGLDSIGGYRNHPNANHHRSIARILTSNNGGSRFVSVSAANNVRLLWLVPPPAQHHSTSMILNDDPDAAATAEVIAWLPKMIGGLSLLGFTLAIWCTIAIAWLGLTFPTHLYIVPR